MGVAGFAFLSNVSDSNGKLNTVNTTGSKSFRVSAVEPCSLTIANQQKRGGVRLSFGAQTGATLTRVQYPMTTTPVSLAQGFYDVQASDDVLIFQLSSVTNTTSMATFKWTPSPL
jgi:hypothetical protein